MDLQLVMTPVSSPVVQLVNRAVMQVELLGPFQINRDKARKKKVMGILRVIAG